MGLEGRAASTERSPSMADRYDIDRDRDRDRDREHRREDWDRQKDRERDRRFGEARYENYAQQRPNNEFERDDYNSNRGDWGSQGRWGAYGNRADYDRENTWRENRDRGEGPHLPRSPESDFGGQRSSRLNLFGTGGGGFG